MQSIVVYYTCSDLLCIFLQVFQQMAMLRGWSRSGRRLMTALLNPWLSWWLFSEARMMWRNWICDWNYPERRRTWASSWSNTDEISLRDRTNMTAWNHTQISSLMYVHFLLLYQLYFKLNQCTTFYISIDWISFKTFWHTKKNAFVKQTSGRIAIIIKTVILILYMYCLLICWIIF